MTLYYVLSKLIGYACLCIVIEDDDQFEISRFFFTLGFEI